MLVPNAHYIIYFILLYFAIKSSAFDGTTCTIELSSVANHNYHHIIMNT